MCMNGANNIIAVVEIVAPIVFRSIYFVNESALFFTAVSLNV